MKMIVISAISCGVSPLIYLWGVENIAVSVKLFFNKASTCVKDLPRDNDVDVNKYRVEGEIIRLNTV